MTTLTQQKISSSFYNLHPARNQFSSFAELGQTWQMSGVTVHVFGVVKLDTNVTCVNLTLVCHVSTCVGAKRTRSILTPMNHLCSVCFRQHRQAEGLEVANIQKFQDGTRNACQDG